MPAKLTLESSIHGVRAIVLESDDLWISVLPEVGAKIYDLVWKPRGRDFLWHNSRILPQPYPLEGNFDNYWCGGWDDAFPTCDSCEHKGEQYAALGELRSVKWKVEAAGEDAEKTFVKLSAFGPINPVRAEKTIVLLANSPVLQMHYKIANLGPLPLDYIWGTHPALEGNENLILRIPAKTGIVGQSTDPRLGAPKQRYAWPMIETPAGVTDMSRVQGINAGVACGHYATDLEAGWYAVEDTSTGEGFMLKFPLEQFPYLWLWLVYGGWRGYHHVIVEPWTGYPNRLSEAVEHKNHSVLPPGGKFAADFAATYYGPEEGYEAALKRLTL